MKRYREYMDGVQPPEDLREKLLSLKAPERRTSPLLMWGALAACLALAVGLLWTFGGMDRQTTADVPSPEPAIAAAPPTPNPIEPGPASPEPVEEVPSEPTEPAGTAGGYEVRDGEIACYYMLPALNWLSLSSSGMDIAADYALAPSGALSRDAEAEDLAALCGGEKAMAGHLLWDGMEVHGILYFLEDGTPQAAALTLSGEGRFLSLELMRGGQVPFCPLCLEADYEPAVWQGVEITALSDVGTFVQDGEELTQGRTVSFLTDGLGCKLTAYTDDADLSALLCTRFVRYACDGGIDLDALPVGDAEGQGKVDEPRYEAPGEEEPSPIPDRGTPPDGGDAPVILHPGDPGYVEPMPEPTPDVEVPSDPVRPVAQ